MRNLGDHYEQIIIIGAGGHGKVIADCVKAFFRDSNGIWNHQTIAFLDDNKPAGSEVMGIPVLGKIEDCVKFKDAAFLIGIGDNSMRKQIAMQYDLNYITILHPSAIVGTGVHIDKGTVVMANAVINAETKIGAHCVINTGAIIEHDNKISDYVHISPGAVLGGNVSVGTGTWVGIGAVVRNNIEITGDCKVGAGAVVVKDINDRGIYVGIPAVKIK